VERKLRWENETHCYLSAGRHGDARAFYLLEGIILIVLPTDTRQRDNEQEAGNERAWDE